MTPPSARAPAIPTASAKPGRGKSATPSWRDASPERPVPTATAATAPAPVRARRATWRHQPGHARCFQRTLRPATDRAPGVEPAPAPARARPTAPALSRRAPAERLDVQPRPLRKPPGCATPAPATCHLLFLARPGRRVRDQRVLVRRERLIAEPADVSTLPAQTQTTVDPAPTCVPRTNTAAQVAAPAPPAPRLVVAVSLGTLNQARTRRRGTSK